MSAKTPEHEELKMRLMRWLDSTAEAIGFASRLPSSSRIGTSLPEPDIAVVEPASYRGAHPSTACS